MSAIGGIFSPDIRLPLGEALISMSRAMMLRGKEKRGAYIDSSLVMMHNGSDASQDLPLVKELGGRPCALAIDGYVYDLENTESDSAKCAMHSYLDFKNELVCHIDGSYALAVCDEARGELILARDKKGSRPLFYSTENGSIAFASEIKGLIRTANDSARIDTARLRAHISSPCGAYSGADIYMDVYSLPAGHCGVYSRLGMNVFPFKSENDIGDLFGRSIAEHPDFYCPDKSEMREMLTELLFAFDYPQFDHMMPCVLKLLKKAASRHISDIAVEDPTLCMNIGYATERADRLGAISGVNMSSVSPSSFAIKDKSLKKMESVLAELLQESDTDSLCRLLCSDWQELLSKEKNIVRRIRMLGMMYQTIVWEKNYPIIFM